MRVCVTALVFALSAAAQTPARPVVQARGEAAFPIQPDVLSIDFGVSTDASTDSAAVEANARRATEVIGAMRRLLGPNADIRTVSFSVTPPLRVVPVYTASYRFQVQAGSLSGIARIVDVAVAAGATDVGAVSFRLRDPAPAYARASQAAARAARRNAEAIAMQLGGTLGSVVSVVASMPSIRSVNFVDLLLGRVELIRGEPEVTASVLVEFELIQ